MYELRPEDALHYPHNGLVFGDAAGEMRQELEPRAALKEIQRAREGSCRRWRVGDTYVPSEANTVLLAEALRLRAEPLLEQGERLFERWHRPDGVG